MTRVAWLGGIAAIAAIALLVAFRGPDAASAGSCTRVEGYLSFCLNVPFSLTRPETTVPLVFLPTERADVRIDATIAKSRVTCLAADIDRSVERIEALFAHRFARPPRLFLFGTSTTFAVGAHDLFGYSRETATYFATTYSGLFDRPTATIALDWSASTPDQMSAAIAHELTHLMIRDITRRDDIPAWLDEGIATVVAEDAAPDQSQIADDALVARAVASSKHLALDQLEDLADFHLAYAMFGRSVYAYSAATVRGMETRLEWKGVLAMLDELTAGGDVGASYQARTGESVVEVSAHVAGVGPAIDVSGEDGSGNVTWTLVAGAADADNTVRITGGTGYEVTFAIRTDALGMYRGSFGSTASPGTYTVSVDGAHATFYTVRPDR